MYQCCCKLLLLVYAHTQISDVSHMGVLVHQMASAALQCLQAAEQHAQAQAQAAAAATAAAATAGATAAANQATADAAAAAAAAADADMDVEGANGTDETVEEGAENGAEEQEGEGSFDPDAETDEVCKHSNALVYAAVLSFTVVSQ